MDNIFDKIKKNKAYIISFALAIAVMLLAYISNGIFKEYSIILNDLENQYIKFLTYYRNDAIKNGILYSFSKGLGGNFFGIFSYYLASPLNLIIFLFSPAKIEIAISIIILLRFGLAAVAFTWFLKRFQKNANDWLCISFGLMYALSSYIVVISYHILWADAFVLLPIVVAFALDLFEGKSVIKFIIAFTFISISNYYMAYMIGIFCICLFIHHCISYGNFENWKHSFLNISKGALISLGLSAWILIPSVFSLLQGKYTLDAYLRDSIGIRAFNIFAIIPKMFVGGYDSVGNISAPFVYCGSAVMFFFIASFFIKNRTKREKIADAVMMIFLFVSLIFMPLNKVWHMFSVTNSFPFRFTYIVVFFALWVAFIACNNLKQLDIKKFIPVATIIMTLYVGFGVWFPNNIRNRFILFNILVTLILSVCVYFAEVKNKKLLYLAFTAFVLLDMSLNAHIIIGKNYAALTPHPKEEFEQNYTSIFENYKKIDDDDFYRVRTSSFCNTSFLLGFNCCNKPFTSLLEVESENVYYNTYSNNDTVISDVVVGVDYLFDDYDFIKTQVDGFPLLYVIDSLPDIQGENKGSLASYIKYITNIDVVDENGITNIQALQQASEYVNSKNSSDNIKQKRNKVTAQITTEKENQVLATSIIWDDGWSVKVNGKKAEKQRILSNFIAVDLPQGECNIQFMYIPKGLKVGAVISVITLIGCCCSLFIKKKK